MNQRDLGIVRRYEASNKTDLYQAYGRTSQAKRNAWEFCRTFCERKNGHGLKIIGANSWTFSAAFKYVEDGVEYLMYITADHNRKIRLEEE